MKTRRILVFLLCAVFLTGIFSGCGSSEDKQDGTTLKQDSATLKQNEEATTKPAPAVRPEPMKLQIYVQALLTDGMKDEEVLKAVSDTIWNDKGISIDMEFVSDTFENENSTINLRLAANELDMFVTFGNGLSYMTDDMTEDITDVLQKYGQNILKIIPGTSWKNVTKNGRIKGIASPPVTKVGIVPWIRKDLLDKVGLKVPTTPQELETAILAIQATDSTLIGISSMLAQWVNLCFSSYGVPTEPLDKDGFIKPYEWHNYSCCYYEEPYTEEYWEFLAGWYKKGILNQELFTMTAEKHQDLITRGKVIASAADIRDPYYNGGYYSEKDTSGNDSDATWVVMDQLTSFNGGNAIWKYHPDSYSYLTWITKGIGEEKVEAAITLLDWLCEKPENMLMAKFGIEDVTYRFNEKGRISKIKDEADSPLYHSKLSGLLGVHIDATDGLAYDFVSNEYMKMYSDDTKGFYWPDGALAYTADQELSIISTDSLTIIDEYYVKAITGAMPVKEAIAQMRNALDKAGAKKVYENRLAQFKAAYPNGIHDYTVKPN